MATPNFAVLSITYYDYPTFVDITVTTDIPCNLTCHYTYIEPQRHPWSRTIRGLQVMWGTYFCFVGSVVHPQQEPGDTYIHTFRIPNWFYCEYRWMVFRATVSGILSPSISPIFKHHNNQPAYTLFEHFVGPGTWYRSIRGVYWAAQTFTTQIYQSHDLKELTLYMARLGHPQQLDIGLRHVDPAGKPLDVDIFTISVNWDYFSDPAFDWRSFYVVPPSYLAQYTQFAIVLRSPLTPSPVGGPEWEWRFAYPGTYGQGQYWGSTNSGLTWQPFYLGSADFLFKEYGDLAP